MKFEMLSFTHSKIYIHLYSPKRVEKKNNTKTIKSERKANN